MTNSNYRTAIIFASHIPSRDKIWIGEEIIDKITNNVSDSYVIFSGINPSDSTQDWVELLRRQTDYIEITPNHLIVKSDASAYQSALRAYSSQIGKFDIIIFLHTQGTKSGNHRARNSHLDCLLNKYQLAKNEIFSKGTGLYCNTLVPVDLESAGTGGVWNALDAYCSWPYRAWKWFPAGTMYMMRASILDNFLKRTNPNFLNELLLSGNPWFFERDFPQIVIRSGFLMKSRYLIHCIPRLLRTMGRLTREQRSELYIKEVNAWLKNNNLDNGKIYEDDRDNSRT